METGKAVKAVRGIGSNSPVISQVRSYNGKVYKAIITGSDDITAEPYPRNDAEDSILMPYSKWYKLPFAEVSV